MSELNVVEPRELTSVERRVLNNVSMEQNANVKLGEIISEILDNVQPGTPVNAAYAEAALEVVGISHGETLTIGDDIYEVTAREDAVVAEGHIAIPVYDISAPATGALTMAVQPTAGDTITIGEKTYIFVPDGTDTADGEVSIGADLAEAQAALVAAVNGFSRACQWVENGVSWVYDKGVPGLVGGASKLLHCSVNGSLTRYLLLAVAGVACVLILFLLMML